MVQAASIPLLAMGVRKVGKSRGGGGVLGCQKWLKNVPDVLSVVKGWLVMQKCKNYIRGLCCLT